MEEQAFGSDLNPVGMMNVFGRRPDSQYPRGATTSFADNILMNIFPIETTQESLARFIPPPLEVDPDAPPVMSAVIWQVKNMRAFDWRPDPYTEFGFWIPCRYKKSHKGITINCLFLDDFGHDIGIIGGRESGYPKRHAHIFINREENRMNACVVRRAVPIATMEMRVKGEIPVDQNSFPMQSVLLVKESPNCSFTGYDVRKVVDCRLGEVVKIERGWVAEGSIEFRHTETDSLDLLKIKKIGPCMQFQLSGIEGANRSNIVEIEDLLKK